MNYKNCKEKDQTGFSAPWFWPCLCLFILFIILFISAWKWWVTWWQQREKIDIPDYLSLPSNTTGTESTILIWLFTHFALLYWKARMLCHFPNAKENCRQNPRNIRGRTAYDFSIPGTLSEKTSIIKFFQNVLSFPYTLLFGTTLTLNT